MQELNVGDVCGCEEAVLKFGKLREAGHRANKQRERSI